MNTVVKKRAIENYLDSEMHEVPKDFFFEGMQLHVTVYLQIKPQNYLVIGRKAKEQVFLIYMFIISPIQELLLNMKITVISF